MAKIHPQLPKNDSDRTTSSKQETFTIWMKSLVLGSKGCTVFDSNGQIVYRVDNYHCKCSNQVYLMDVTGKLLFTVRRKKFKLFSFWEGFKAVSNNGKVDDDIEVKTPNFQVRKSYMKDSSCQVIVWLDKDRPLYRYQIENCTEKSKLFRIVDKKIGNVIAEVKRKQSKSGVSLGEDVLTMVVEPHVDHSLIMGIIVVYSLIQCKM